MANCWARPAMGSSLPARSIRGCCGGRRSDHPSAQGEKPMYAVPDVDEGVAGAKEVGLHLSPGGGGPYRKDLLEQPRQVGALVPARPEGPGAPMGAARRKPRYPP